MRRGALALGLGLALALLGGWAVLDRNSAEPAGATPAPELRTAQPVPETPVLADTGSAASAPVAASHIPAWSPRALHMHDDWCGFGLEAHRHDLDALETKKARRPQSQFVDLNDFADERKLEGSQLIAAAADAARQRWVRALRARGDTRSLAVADFLQGWDADAPSSTAARARLQALARQSTDPFVTSLALQRPCAPGACRNVDAAQWSRLEPGNVEAWLTLIDGTAGGAARLDVRDYVWSRLVEEARYSRNYLPGILRVVREVVPTDSRGIDVDGEFAAFSVLSGAWHLPSVRTVTERCVAGQRRRQASASNCLRVAEAMWNGGHLLSRVIASRVASDSITPAEPERRSWEARESELQALRAFLAAQSERESEQRFATNGAHASCDQTREAFRRLTDPERLDEWARMQADFKAAGGRVDEWAAKRRVAPGAGS